MATTVNVTLDDSDHERLAEYKDEHGLTWREMLFAGTEVDA